MTESNNRIVKIIGDFRTIWAAGIFFIGGIVWAGDQRYTTHDYLDRRLIKQETRAMARTVKELQLKVDLGRATDYDMALLQMKKQELEQMKADAHEK